ncbi:MAG TPA: acetate uptake transporter [Pseudonocardiaceae bacterium]|nr:acetate uptake transporter [Pseudonocardiaceae bacterium]
MSTTSTGTNITTPTATTPTAAAPVAEGADPGPLGLAGFAATTMVLSIANTGIVGKGVVFAVLPLALFYGGLGQLLAGMWEFRKGNTFGATAFSTYGSFWLAYAFYAWLFASKIPSSDTAAATGLFLLVFAIVTLYLIIPALRLNAALVGVFVLLTATFVLLSIGAFASSDPITKIGGWVGLATAVVAFYTSAAVVTNATWKRIVLPVFPLS